MAKAKQVVIGLKKEVFDEATDVSTEFHTIHFFTLNLKEDNHLVTLDSYARQRTYERGGRPVNSVQFSLSGKAPIDDTLLEWIYRSVAAAEMADVYQGLTNHLHGAELVYGTLPDAEETEKAE